VTDKKKIFMAGIIIMASIFFYPFCLEAVIAEYLKDDINPAVVISQFNNQLALHKPADIYIDSRGNLYVIDIYHQAVFIYNDQFQPLTRLDRAHGLQKPIAVAADRRGNIYVSDAEKGILVFNSLGRITRTIDVGLLTGGKVRYARDLVIDTSNYMYLATGTELGVLVLNGQDKLKKSIIPKDVLKEGAAPSPVAIKRIAMDSQERMYLVCEDMGRVYVYEDPDTFLFRFGQKGGSIGKLSRPVGVAVDCSKELIYILDYMRHTISIYNLKGVFLEEYGGQGKDPGWFNHPSQICIDKRQQLVVADTFNHRIQVLTINPR